MHGKEADTVRIRVRGSVSYEMVQWNDSPYVPSLWLSMSVTNLRDALTYSSDIALQSLCGR